MQKASDILNKTYTGTSTGNLLQETWVAAIFEKMRLRYGNIWTRQIGSTEKELSAKMMEWAKLCCYLTAEQIRYGLDTWDSEFPPNVYQFRTCCRSNKRSKAHTIVPQLPKPERHKDVAAAAVAEMKQCLPPAEIQHAEAVGPLDTSRDRFKAHGAVDNEYDAWLMSKPHADGEQPIKNYGAHS